MKASPHPHDSSPSIHARNQKPAQHIKPSKRRRKDKLTPMQPEGMRRRSRQARLQPALAPLAAKLLRRPMRITRRSLLPPHHRRRGLCSPPRARIRFVLQIRRLRGICHGRGPGCGDGSRSKVARSWSLFLPPSVVHVFLGRDDDGVSIGTGISGYMTGSTRATRNVHDYYAWPLGTRYGKGCHTTTTTGCAIGIGGLERNGGGLRRG